MVSGTTILRVDGSEPDVISGKHGFNEGERFIQIVEDNLNKK